MCITVCLPAGAIASVHSAPYTRLFSVFFSRLSIFRLLLRQVQNEKPWKSVFEGAKTEKSYELAEAVQAKLWVTNLEYFFVVICLFPRKILHFSGPIFAALLFTLSFRDTQTKRTLSSPSLLKKSLTNLLLLNTRKPMIEH